MRAIILASLLFLAQVAAAAPKVTIEVETPPTAGSRLTLKVSDEPLASVLERVATSLGFSQVECPDRELGKAKVTCDFKDRPAWQCLLELAEKHAMTFGIQDRTLRIAPAGEGVVMTYTGGERFLACFAQRPSGAPVAQGGIGCGVWILTARRLAATCTALTIEKQGDAAGKACAYVSLPRDPRDTRPILPADGRVRLAAGKEAPSPWKSLGSLTFKMKSELVTKRVVATFSGLDLSGAGLPLSAKHGEELLPRLDALVSRGNFVDVETSLPSTSAGEFVMQSRRGMDPMAIVAARYGVLPELLDAAGNRFLPAVLVGKGDGTRVKLTFRVTRHQAQKAGGLARVSLRWTKVLSSTTREDLLEFDPLKRK